MNLKFKVMKRKKISCNETKLHIERGHYESSRYKRQPEETQKTYFLWTKKNYVRKDQQTLQKAKLKI